MEPHLLEHILDGRQKPTNLQLELLKSVTDNFSQEREIGHGGFATVYKGVLPNGNIAVKRIMNGHTIDEKLFYGEVNSLLTINHRNIVRFLGFCASTDQTAIKQEGKREHIYAEIRERLICFEYISNGNLQNYITDELRGLDWSTRYRLIKGICDGLHYLHMEKYIYHMDLKPANILLDDDMVPKITDFGLSRLDEKSQTLSVARHGTLGYCAPEYLHCGKMSFKSDIYSLGNIIIELVTGVKSIPDNNKNNVLRRWRHRWRKTGMESPLGYKQVTKCINIGLHCQEIDPCNRPFIWEIVRDINEMEGTNLQISNDNESTVGQISPYSEDDMLGIEPLELHFPFRLNKELSCSLQLTNDTDSYIAFEVQKMSPLPYCTEPREGIIPPRSNCGVDITLQPQDNASQRANEFIVRSTKVNSGLTSEHITTAMFNKYTGNVVDEVNLDVVFDHEVIPGSSALLPGSSALLDVHPLELRFRFEPNKFMACALDLTNNTDEHVAFGLLKKSDEQTCFLSSLPMFGSVDPGTTYTLAVIMNKHKYLPQKRTVDLILQASKYYGIVSDVERCKQHFQKAEELGNTVHRVTLKGVCALQGETPFESIPPSIKIISVEDNGGSYISAMDANETEPLIITSHSSSFVQIWDSDTQKSMGSIYISDGAQVISVKFVARMGWFLAGTHDGFIHVCNYKKETQNITRIRAHGSYFKPQGSYTARFLAIHPTQSYVLSACLTEIKLLDWDHRWKCMRTFNEHSSDVCALAFNQEDYKSFASASIDGKIKVWSLDSSKSKYTLSGHSNWVNFVDFFTRDGQQYLITGSNDNTAKIWDMKQECVHTLPHRFGVRCVLPHPKLPVLVTGIVGGHVYLWSSINFRLKRIINVGDRSDVRGLACLIDSGRVVIAQDKVLSVIEIRDEEEQGESSSSSSSNKEHAVFKMLSRQMASLSRRDDR